MKKVAVVFWSSTGNTQTMAMEIANGAKDKGATVDVFATSDFSSSMVNDYDGFAFGCPAMGAEELEDGEFEPLFNECKPLMANKPVAIFGSYGWGEGDWMQMWQDDCKSSGLNLICDGVMANYAPSGDDSANCKQLGEKLVEAV